MSYPAVDPVNGSVHGADIGFAGTPWENFRHIVDGNQANTDSADAKSSIEKNQVWQLQLRLGLNNPDVIMQAAQFVPSKDYKHLHHKSGNPREFPDMFTWPSTMGVEKKGFTLADVPAIIEYFDNSPDGWPVIHHEEGNVASG